MEVTEAVQDLSKGDGVSLLVSDPCVGDVLERITGYNDGGFWCVQIFIRFFALFEISRHV